MASASISINVNGKSEVTLLSNKDVTSELSTNTNAHLTAAAPPRRRSLIDSNSGLHPGLQSYEENELVQQPRIYKREALVPGIKPKRVLENSRSRHMYIEACEELRIAPSSQVLNLLNTSSLNVQHYGLRNKDGEAIAAAINVSECPVTSILFRGNSVSSSGLVALCKSITSHASLNVAGISELDLRDNSITDVAATEAIGDMLAQSGCTIEVLRLGGNKFKKAGLSSIMGALARNTKCVELDLVNCKLGDGCGKLIGDMLQRNRSMRNLYLGWNNIGASGMMAIASGLTTSDHVQKLSVEFNCIGNGGCTALSRLKKSKSLQILDISYNSIGSTGLKCLLSALVNNKSLRQLHFDGNLVGDDGAESMFQLLDSGNSGIEFVSTGCCGIEDSMVIKIDEKCKSLRSGERNKI